MLKGGIREWKEKGYEVAQADPRLEAAGPRLYKQHCAACHGVAGEGLGDHFPPLKNDPMMTSAYAWPAIWVTLQGLGGRPLAGKQYQGAMGGFKNILTDQEIAELLTYARREFGGVAVPVYPADVRRVREQIDADRAKPRKGR